MRKKNEAIMEEVKAFILVDQVADKYKDKPSDFTRTRKLPFKHLGFVRK